MRSDQLIDRLELVPHPEGGYYRRIYTAGTRVQSPWGERAQATAIHYLLTDDQPVGHLHVNRADILHLWQLGAPVGYITYDAHAKRLERTVLGPDLAAGQALSLVVPGGVWKASQLTQGPFGLVSEAVTPGFDPADMRFVVAAELADLEPGHARTLAPFVRAA